MTTTTPTASIAAAARKRTRPLLRTDAHFIRCTIARRTITAVMPAVAFAVGFAVLAVVVPASAVAFGPLGHVAVGDHFPEPYKTLVENNRHAFNTGAMFPDLEELPNVPTLIEQLYRSFNPRDKYVPLGTATHSIHLALDLLQKAETEEQAAFAVGFLSHIVGDMITRHHYLQKKLSEHGHRMVDREAAASTIDMMGDLRLSRRYATSTMVSLRQRNLSVFLFFAHVAKQHPWNAPISDEDFMSNVALHEFATEMKITATGPGGSVGRGLQRLNEWMPGIAGFTAPSHFEDIDEAIRLTALATASIVEHGYRSPWLRDGWGFFNPYPGIAGAAHWPLRTAQQAELPAGWKSPNPAFVIHDAWFADADGNRIDHAPPTACRGADGQLRPVTARLRISAWQPISAKVKLVVRAHRQRGDDPEIAEISGPVTFTDDDVRHGRIRELAVPFVFAPDRHGPYRRTIFNDFTRGFYVVARVQPPPAAGAAAGGGGGGGDDGKWLTFFSTSAVRSQELGGYDTYRDWPFSLEVSPEFSAAGRRLDAGQFMKGKSNEPPRPRFSDDRPAGFSYRFPYAVISPEPAEVHVQTSDERTLIGTLYRAHGSKRGVILLHMYPGSRHDFMYLQPLLRDAGFTSLAIDFRGKNNSGTAEDRAAYAAGRAELFNALDRDVAAAKKFLIEHCSVDARRIALVGGSVGSSAALRAAATDREIAGAVLLSPGLNYLGVDSREDMSRYGERPLFMTFAAEAPGEADAVEQLKGLHGKPESVVVERFAADSRRGHATRQFRLDPELPSRIVAFLDRHVPTLE